jgi:5-methylthioadenosine/S-adenosylhomocysteine deaminase
MALVLSGQCVPCDADDPKAVFRGRVFVSDTGLVEKVVKEGNAAPAGFQSAPLMDVGESYIVPGLIDLHNHIGYNALPLWAEPTRKTPYAHHDSWPGAPSYQSSISWPANTLVETEPEALLAYVQLRALVGGTTAIQGWPNANRKFVQVLRNIDDGPDATGSSNLLLTSTLTLQPLELAKRAQAQKNGSGFIYHCGEGTSGSLVEREFVNAANAGCLRENFISIHCNAVRAADWKRWAKDQAGAVVWSPFSNYWLYGSTTDIKAVLDQGVLVCIGSDWAPSGTKNVQAELKVAKLASAKLGLGLSDFDLFKMVTTNPGDALQRSWKKSTGRLVAGALADITVIRAKSRAASNNAVWTHLVRSTEADIALVVVGGIGRYGDATLMQKQNVPSAKFKIKGKNFRFAIPNPQNQQKAWEFSEFTGLLNAVIANPKAAIIKAEGRMRAYAGRMDAPEAPLVLALDMPSGGADLAANLKKHADKIVVPPLASLVHDKAFFDSIRGRGFHNKLLDGLKGFYA